MRAMSERGPYERKYTHYIFVTIHYTEGWGEHEVAQLVEALRYKPEGRGFDSPWCHWDFSLT
jgi:hypothetical protein